MAVHQYYDAHNGNFFLHHPFLADVDAQAAAADSFAEIYWEDKLQPFIGGQLGDARGLARDGHRPTTRSTAARAIFRSRAVSVTTTGQSPTASANRTSYLMNSLLSHKTSPLRPVDAQAFSSRGRHVAVHVLLRAQRRCVHARDAARSAAGRLRHLAGHRHHRALDRQRPARRRWPTTCTSTATSTRMPWDDAVVDMYPDKQVLTEDGTYAE